jgi:hypothetical protein
MRAPMDWDPQQRRASLVADLCQELRLGQDPRPLLDQCQVGLWEDPQDSPFLEGIQRVLQAAERA